MRMTTWVGPGRGLSDSTHWPVICRPTNVAAFILLQSFLHGISVAELGRVFPPNTTYVDLRAVK
jgi:hypothetical protein